MITEKSEEWVSLADKTYTVTYTVKNIGNASADASKTSIYVDGVHVANNSVGVLAAGESYTTTFSDVIMMSGNNDTIVVCADNNNNVSECNETNNCLENLFEYSGVAGSYGDSVYFKENVSHTSKALGEPNNQGALMLWNATIAIELEETIPECEKVSVWVRKVAVRPSTFEVDVSSDGTNWTTIGDARCYSWRWQRFDFTNDSGNWEDVKYIKIAKPGSWRKPKLMGLDAVYAEE